MRDDAPGGLLRTIVTALETAAIPHMVVGSFASTAHGEPRTTRDLDLVIDPRPDQLHELLGSLDAEQFYVDPDVARDALRRRSMFNIIEIATGWKLDFTLQPGEDLRPLVSSVQADGDHERARWASRRLPQGLRDP